MPTYYFHSYDGHELIKDPEGSNFPDLGKATEAAKTGARDWAADLIKGGHRIDGHAIQIMDVEDNLMRSVLLREIILEPGTPLQKDNPTGP